MAAAVLPFFDHLADFLPHRLGRHNHGRGFSPGTTELFFAEHSHDSTVSANHFPLRADDRIPRPPTTEPAHEHRHAHREVAPIHVGDFPPHNQVALDRKSTRLNSSHVKIS